MNVFNNLVNKFKLFEEPFPTMNLQRC